MQKWKNIQEKLYRNYLKVSQMYIIGVLQEEIEIKQKKKKQY